MSIPSFFGGPIGPPTVKEMVKWEKHFAWLPVTVDGRWAWLKTVYRKRSRIKVAAKGLYVDWEYGTIFDVLKND